MKSSFKLWFWALARYLRWPLVLMLVFSVTAQAESVYVTDMLRLDMYPTAEMTGPVLLKLRSGDRMELLESDGRYARVRSDGGQEGWVKSLYLVDEEPARTRVNKLEQANVSLEATVQKLRSQLADQQAKVTQMQQQREGSAELSAATQQELANLREENADLADSMSQYKSSVPLFWLFIAIIVALAGGIAGGWYVVDRRSRSKHGGYRIY